MVGDAVYLGNVRKMSINTLSKLLFISYLLLLGGCGGGGSGGSGGGNPGVTTTKAVLLDGVVQGVRYDAGSGVTGVTDANGVFDYVEGQSVSFYLGNILLGTASPIDKPAGLTGILADKIVTPLELVGVNANLDDPQVLNRVRLLLTLDADGNPNNGIQIAASVVAALQSTSSLDFGTAFDPTTILQTASTASGQSMMLVDSTTAKQHLCDSLQRDCTSGGGNHAPTISGTPATSMDVGSAYSFTPAAEDLDGDAKTFSITNKPSWASFSTSTGALTGTPTAVDVGITSNIIISVTDGKSLSVALPAFNLAVIAPVTPLNLAPYGTATQKSTYNNDIASNGAANVIDGKTDTINHTACQSNDWWQLELKNESLISEITVTNRTSSYRDVRDRLKGATVYLSNTPAASNTWNASELVKTLSSDTDPFTGMTFSVDPARSARYVIVKTNGSACLHMAEVAVKGIGSDTLEFAKTSYAFEVKHRTAQGGAVGTVKAIQYAGRAVTYSIDGTVPFAIDAQGNISVTGELNRETYTFTVKATDGLGMVSVPVTVQAPFNLALEFGVATQSSTYNSSSTAGNAIDDKLETTNHTNCEVGDWWQVKLPDPTLISRIVVTGRDTWTSRLNGAEVYVSANSATNGGMSAGDKVFTLADTANAQNILLATPKSGTYVIVKAVPKTGGTECLHMREVEVYGQAPDAPVLNLSAYSFQLSNRVAVGQWVGKVTAVDYQKEAIAYSITGAAVPFAIDAQGNIAVSSALQAGVTYNFTVTARDGVNSVNAPVTVVVTSSSSVEDALRTGDASVATTEELLDATLASITANQRLLLDAKVQLFNLNTDGTAKADGTSLTAVDWNPTHDASLLQSSYGMNTPVLMTNAVTDADYTVYQKEIGIIGERGSRYMVLGGNPLRNYYRDNASINSQMHQFMENSLSWLTARTNLKTAPFNVVIAHMDDGYYFPDERAIRAWLDQRYAGQVSYNAANSCDDGALRNCLTSTDAPDLLIISQQMNTNTDPSVVAAAVNTAMARGIPVLYLHLDGDLTDLGNALLSLFHVTYHWDNYWKRLKLTAFDVRQSLSAIPAEIRPINALLQHLKAQDYAFDWSACDEENCSAVVGLSTEFQQGAAAVRSMMSAFDTSKMNLFAGEGFRFQKLLVLLGDSYRKDAHFPMDKVLTDDTTFLKSLFADHAVYNYRTLNPVQPDMGNFSRSDFSHITPVNKTVTMTSRQNFRAAGVYALPGKTVRVTRNDNSSTTTKVFINSLRSGSTHEFEAWGYKRPKFLESAHVPIKSGETITLTSPYGGPIQIDFGTNDQSVSFTFEQVGEHPFWDDTSDNAAFTAKLAAGEYDWAEFVTPAFEIHSTLEKMRESATDTRWGGTLEGFAAATMRYIHNFPHVLAGFKGPNIDVVSEIHNFATSNGFTIENLDLVKHMNADQATCGSGCSGNPYDAYWAFDPIGHGDIHEMGHGLEKGRFRLSGWNYHASTNPYSYYSKTQYYKTTGGNPDCQSLPFYDAFVALQASVGQANPTTYLKTNYWDAVTDNWSRAASMTIQMMMTAEHQGALADGWHLLARLHILEREFNRARSDATTWDVKKTSLGFSSYSKAEADAINNNDWMVIAVSKVTGMDYRSYFSMWGQAYSTKANDQVVAFNHAAAERRFFITSPNGYCKGEGFDGNYLPVDGNQTWPLSTVQPRLMGDSFR